MSHQLIGTIYSASNLKNTQFFGKQDPYAKLSIRSQEITTQVHNNGGINPVWNHKFSFTIAASDVDKSYVNVQVKNKNMTKDELIGSCNLPIVEIQKLGGEVNSDFDLYNGTKKSGKIRIELRIVSPDISNSNTTNNNNRPVYAMAAAPPAASKPQYHTQAAPNTPMLPAYPVASHAAPMAVDGSGNRPSMYGHAASGPHYPPVVPASTTSAGYAYAQPASYANNTMYTGTPAAGNSYAQPAGGAYGVATASAMYPPVVPALNRYSTASALPGVSYGVPTTGVASHAAYPQANVIGYPQGVTPAPSQRIPNAATVPMHYGMYPGQPPSQRVPNAATAPTYHVHTAPYGSVPPAFAYPTAPSATMATNDYGTAAAGYSYHHPINNGNAHVNNGYAVATPAVPSNPGAYYPPTAGVVRTAQPVAGTANQGRQLFNTVLDGGYPKF